MTSQTFFVALRLATLSVRIMIQQKENAYGPHEHGDKTSHHVFALYIYFIGILERSGFLSYFVIPIELH